MQRSSSSKVSVPKVDDSVITGAADGNESGIRPKSLQVSNDKKNLSVLPVIYTIWRDILPECVMRTARAPMIPIAAWLAALIFMVVGVRWEAWSPSWRRREVPARHDWQPVSATASMLAVSVGPRRVDLTPRSSMHRHSESGELRRKNEKNLELALRAKRTFNQRCFVHGY